MQEKEPLEEILKEGKLEGMLKDIKGDEQKYITMGKYRILADQYFTIEEIYKKFTGRLPEERDYLLKYYTKIEVNDSGYVICLSFDYLNCTPKEKKAIKKSGGYIAELISKLVIPENLTELKILYLNGITINKLIVPNTLVKLEELSCRADGLRRLDIGNNLINLKKIDCSFNYLKVLKIPKDSVNLEEIDAKTNRLKKVYIPAESKNLKKIDLGDTTYEGEDLAGYKVLKRRLSKKSQRMLDEFRKKGVRVVY